ncbi:MAG: hypothetical protein HW405_472 [Candidatus Berkelbacteria bacterium]|nr:hypothetical protein [Candidatus Berkelbacteria bacterium]
MSLEYKDCLEKQKIRTFSRGKTLAKKELLTAKEDLKRAQATFKQKDYKWTTIQAYYSMFHAARALIYSKNLRERSHQCLIIAIKELFVKEKLLDYRIVEAFQRAKILRENADYYDRFSDESAIKMVEKAEEFILKAEELLNN